MTPSAHLLDLALRAASVLGSFAGAGKGSRDARCHTPMPRMQPSRGKVGDAVPMLEAQEPSLRTDVARQVGQGKWLSTFPHLMAESAIMALRDLDALKEI